MAERLSQLGYPTLASLTLSKITEMDDPLRRAWKAVEWLDSLDWSDRKAILELESVSEQIGKVSKPSRSAMQDGEGSDNVPRWDSGKIICACGGEHTMKLLERGAVPTIDSEGPYVTYGIWVCVQCKRRWIEDDQSEEWEEYLGD